MEEFGSAVIGVGNFAGIHAAAIREHRSPTIDGREGRRSIEVVQAVYSSAQSNAAVRLPL